MSIMPSSLATVSCGVDDRLPNDCAWLRKRWIESITSVCWLAKAWPSSVVHAMLSSIHFKTAA